MAAVQMTAEPYLTETCRTPDGDYVEQWMVPPPAIGTLYRVTAETWSDDLTVRLIHGWEPENVA